MKLYLENGELVLPSDFSFEISHSNPFFDTDGATSAPITLPACEQNLELLGHPEDTHRAHRPVLTFDACLQDGVFFAQCKLVVDTASSRDGISVTLALKESALYAELQDRKLTDIFALQAATISSAWDIYHDIRSSIIVDPTPVEKKVCFFPVAMDSRESNGTVTVNIINQPGTSDFVYNARNWYVNGDTVAMPQYYGITAFLYLWALIEDLFRLCGYTVTENVFKTAENLKDIVVLNNTVDGSCYVSGDVLPPFCIWYRHMVPDMTVGELIGWLRDKFGAVVCTDNREVSVRLFCNLADAAYDLDLSQYVRESVSVRIPEAKRLEMEMNTDIESADPAADCLADLIATYKTRALVAEEDDITGQGLFFVEKLGKYYYRKTSSDSLNVLGTDAYRYTRNIPGVDAETIKLDDTFVPMVKADGMYMPYLGESVRRRIENANDINDGYSQKLMLCYAIFDDESDVYIGSSYRLVNDDDTDDRPALTPEGTVNAYWARYQELTLNSAPEISCRLDLPQEVLLTMDITTPKRLLGDLVLFKSLSFSIDGSEMLSCEAVFQQLTEYTDAAEAPDINIGSGTIEWVLVNTRTVFNTGDTTDGIVVGTTDGLTDYTSADAPSTVPTRVGIIANRRERWLDYTEYTSYRNFLSWGTSSRQYTHHYEEYFISTFNGQ